MATSKRLAYVDKEFYILLLESMIADLQLLFPSSSDSLSLDMLTIRKRVDLEGFTFLTTTLPKLGKAIEKGLEDGVLQAPREFKTHGKIPVLLESLVSRIFGRNGTVLDDACPTALRAVRQIVYFAYRLEFPFDDKTVKRTLDNFVNTEEELKVCAFFPYEPIKAIAKEVTCDILRGFDPKDIVPRHGPGSVATGERGDLKYNFSRLYSSIHRVYPYYDYYIVGGGKELLDRLEWYKGLSRLESGHSKVVLVPKDSRGPRLICCEPLEYQWIQQGLGRKLCSFLQKRSGGCIQFTDQSINQRLALSSSIDGRLATLDMKDASDRISLRLIDDIFPDDLRRCLYACRTVAADLPDGRCVTLAKHAPMGSCLCFPIEALCFYALAVAAVEFELGVSRSTAMRQIHVYGDDIIIPVEWFDAVTSTYESYRLKVNYDKSFRKGSFRESCGTDAFKGVDVTPIKLRTLWSRDPNAGTSLASWVEYANALSFAGYIRTGYFLRRRITEVFGPIPVGIAGSSCRGESSRGGEDISSFISWINYSVVFSGEGLGSGQCDSGNTITDQSGTLDRGPDVNKEKSGGKLPARTFTVSVEPESRSPIACYNYNRNGFRCRWSRRLQRGRIHARVVRSTNLDCTLTGWARLLRNLTRGEGEFPHLTAVAYSASVKWGWFYI